MASSFSIPAIGLKSGSGKIPVLGFGTAAFGSSVDSETVKRAVLDAIEFGYRHFDTAPVYGSEQPLGEAIAEAINSGLIKSRDELFITSKLWNADAHSQHVVPALKRTLENLGLDYLDLYLIHWPVSLRHTEELEYPFKAEDILQMDFESVWATMEECQRMGLTKAIGVCNFTCKKLQQILATAKIKPAVNQVEVSPCWQQKKLIQFCKDNGILVIGYSVLGAVGASYGSNRVLESEVLKQIAQARGKTVAQVCLRWANEQGIGVLVKSFNRERIKLNLDIFDWSLSSEEVKKISEIPQARTVLAMDIVTDHGPYKSIEELWDGEL